MDDSLLPFVEVQMHWAARHLWRAGDSLSSMNSVYSLWFVLDGALEVSVGGQPWHVPAGSAFLLPSGVSRDIVAPRGAEWLSVGLSAHLFRRIDMMQIFQPPVLWTPADGEKEALQTWMRQSSHEWVEDPLSDTTASPLRASRPLLLPSPRKPRNPTSTLISAGLGRALFGLCRRMLDGGGKSAATRYAVPSWLTVTLEHIARAPGARLPELSRIAGISPAQLRRGFHRWIGVSPQTYLTRHRLEEARRLLVTTNLAVGVVAERVGFESLSYFTRLFKQTYGLPPAQYRHAAKQPMV